MEISEVDPRCEKSENLEASTISRVCFQIPNAAVEKCQIRRYENRRVNPCIDEPIKRCRLIVKRTSGYIVDMRTNLNGLS